jgi:hypothetical protein
MQPLFSPLDGLDIQEFSYMSSLLSSRRVYFPRICANSIQVAVAASFCLIAAATSIFYEPRSLADLCSLLTS